MDLCGASNEAAYTWLTNALEPGPIENLAFNIPTTDLFYRYQTWIQKQEIYKLLSMEDIWMLIQIAFPKTQIVGNRGRRLSKSS